MQMSEEESMNTATEDLCQSYQVENGDWVQAVTEQILARMRVGCLCEGPCVRAEDVGNLVHINQL
jgi:hypothetical protein